MFDAVEKFDLVLQTAVNVDIKEVIGQQMIESSCVFRYLGLVPQGFKRQHPGRVAVLRRLRMQRDCQHQCGKQKDRATEPRQAAAVMQSRVPPCSYISNRQNTEFVEK